MPSLITELASRHREDHSPLKHRSSPWLELLLPVKRRPSRRAGVPSKMHNRNSPFFCVGSGNPNNTLPHVYCKGQGNGLSDISSEGPGGSPRVRSGRPLCHNSGTLGGPKHNVLNKTVINQVCFCFSRCWFKRRVLASLFRSHEPVVHLKWITDRTHKISDKGGFWLTLILSFFLRSSILKWGKWSHCAVTGTP